MSTLLYHCPNTGLQVQSWIADDPKADGGDSYQSVVCIACQRIHLVNPATGKSASVDDDC